MNKLVSSYDNYNRGTRLLDTGKGDKAVIYFKKQIRTGECNFKELYLNLGNAYRLAGNDTLAAENYLLANSPDIPFLDGRFVSGYDLAYNNLGLMCYRYMDDNAAISHYQKALEINPLHFDAIWNYANAALRIGFSGGECNWNASWQMYEYRFKRTSAPVRVDMSLPRWDELSRVPRICVLAEQGMGDKIMFGRYIHLLEEYCDEVIVQCPVELDFIFSKWKTVRDASIFSGGTYGFPICSLARRFGMVSGEWLDYEKKDKKNGIGIVWSGSSTHANNVNRSIPAGYFKRFSSLGDLYSLNIGVDCPKWAIPNNGKSWEETISLISGLDLVITVDTSIVHLCGSLGIECWMMQPLKETDFRWPVTGERTEWYDSVRIIQNRGTWEKTLDYVYSLVEQRKKDKPYVDHIKELQERMPLWEYKSLPMWSTFSDYREALRAANNET